MDRWVISALLVSVLYMATFLGRGVSSADLVRQNRRPFNATKELQESLNVALDTTFQGLKNISHDEDLQEAYFENATLAWEDAIVDKALVIIGIGAGVVIVVGLAYYAKMGYCTSEV